VLQVSASVGMTVYPEDGVDADQLMRHADQAMFAAKQAGRNRIHVFDSAFEAKVQNRSVQLARIAEALEAGELLLHYQPKVNMREGSVIGVEALIRWEHPERGLLPPAAFLHAIEGHPLEYLVGWWVIEQALMRMDEWLAAGLRLVVGVNVGARQLQHEGFAASLAGLLAKYPRGDPSDLELEILESSALQDIGAVAAGMRDCRGLGVRFSVDDFGTGYSSLAYLRRLPAEVLKIDQSFVRAMLVDSEDLAIVQSVIALAQAFKRCVIAEGVETVEIGERLLDLGCDFAQGFVVARPMAGQEIPGWAAGWRAFPSWRNRPPAA
jgi:EAL domain-containing protein (putative c-di-GMP-specific phosphodiesterase class I)